MGRFRLSRQQSWIGAILILSLAFALRVWDLNARSLWLDEALEYWVAASALPDLVLNIREKLYDPPLYSLLLHFWLQLSPNEFFLRYLSVFFSLLAVSGIICLGRSLSGWSTGLAAGLIMAILPGQIRYAQEVGQYALMQSVLVLNLIALLRLLVKPGWAAFFLWGVSAVIGVYSYYGFVFATLVPFGLLLGEFLLIRRWRSLGQGLVTLTGYGLALIPLLYYFFLGQLFRVGEIFHGPTSTAFQVQATPLAAELSDLFYSTQQLIAFQFTGWPWTDLPPWLPFIAVISLLVLLPRANWRLGGWLLATWGIYYLAGKINLYPYGFRHSLILTPLLVILLGSNLSQALLSQYRRPVAIASLITLVILCGLSLPNRAFRDFFYPDKTWDWPETEDMQPVFSYWLAHQKEEPTYIYYGGVLAFAYYSAKDTATCQPQPSTLYCQPQGVYYGKWIRNLPPAEKIKSIQTTLSNQPKAAWLVFSHIQPGEDSQILSDLAKVYNIALSYQKTGASIYLLKLK